MKTFNLKLMALVLGLGLLMSGVGRAGELHRGGVSTGGSRFGGNSQVQIPAQGRGIGHGSGGGGQLMGATNTNRGAVGSRIQVNSATNKRSYHAARMGYSVAVGNYW